VEGRLSVIQADAQWCGALGSPSMLMSGKNCDSAGFMMALTAAIRHHSVRYLLALAELFNIVKKGPQKPAPLRSGRAGNSEKIGLVVH
jgi:hypothetical protein